MRTITATTVKNAVRASKPKPKLKGDPTPKLNSVTTRSSVKMSTSSKGTPRQTIAEIHAKILPIINTVFTLPKTTNKGQAGLFLEKLLGIPHTSDCLDCLDGELKIFPVKALKTGLLVPKETIAVTQISVDDLKARDFKSSRCFTKMRKMLVVPYLRVGDTVRYLTPQRIENATHADMYATVEADYTLIRRIFLETGEQHSRTGQLLQSRTKGTGHGSNTRAFYLRKAFMKQCFPLGLA